jgi:hypothetical protein
MTNPMTPTIPLAIGVLAALAAAVLWAAANRRGPHGVPGTGPAPVPVTADQSPPRPAGTTGTHDRAVRQMARPPRSRGQPARAVAQAQHIFHELHADGRNALCAVCDNQYGPA